MRRLDGRRFPVPAHLLGLLFLVLWSGAWAATAETTSEPLVQPEADEFGAPRRWTFFGDVRARIDRLSRGSQSDISRERLSIRPGLAINLGQKLEVVWALRASEGTEDAIIGTDNEERSGVRLDQAQIRWLASESTTVVLGKAPSALWLTPMVWDDDLRPIGASWIYDRGVRAYDSVRLAATVFEADHRFDDDSRVAALQAVWSIRDGARVGGELSAAYLDFDRLENLFDSGLGRHNSRDSNGRPVDFELFDVQAAGRFPVGRGSLEARLDHVRNLAVSDRDEGTRLGLTWSGSPENRFEGGVAFQRIQADAVVAAFNSDDWWFHSNVRGGSAWFGARVGSDLTLRIAGFSERLDGSSTRFERLLLDLEYSW